MENHLIFKLLGDRLQCLSTAVVQVFVADKGLTDIHKLQYFKHHLTQQVKCGEAKELSFSTFLSNLLPDLYSAKLRIPIEV